MCFRFICYNLWWINFIWSIYSFLNIVLLVWNIVFLIHFKFSFNSSFIFYPILKLWIFLYLGLFILNLFVLLMNIWSCRCCFFCNLRRDFLWCIDFDIVILKCDFILRNILGSFLIIRRLSQTIFLINWFLL